MSQQPSEPTPDQHAWRDEHRVEILLLNPLVRNRIDRYTRGPRREPAMVAAMKDAFGKGDKAGFVLGLSLAGSALLQRRKRLPRGPRRTDELPLPIGSTIVAALVSFADRDQRLANIEQGSDGCILAAELDLSSFSMPGLLTASIARNGSGSVVEAEVQLPGGPIDFGKRKRILNAFFEDIPRFASLDTHL